MAIEDVLGSLIGLPVAYGNMYNNAYQPMYSYGQSQGQNAASLYGALAAQQANMYQAELPMQMEAQKWNAVAPLLGGLLSQYGLGGNLGTISFQSQRPDLMSGYGNAVGRYDSWMKDYFDRQQAVMPKLPSPQQPASAAPASPSPPPYQPPPYQPPAPGGPGGRYGGGYRGPMGGANKAYSSGKQLF